MRLNEVTMRCRKCGYKFVANDTMWKTQWLEPVICPKCKHDFCDRLVYLKRGGGDINE